MENRTKRLRDDLIDICKTLPTAESETLLTDIKIENFKMAFKLTTVDGASADLTLHFTPDYPEGTVLTDSRYPDDVKQYNEVVGDILQSIMEQNDQNHNVSYKKMKSSESNYTDCMQDLSDEGSLTDDELDSDGADIPNAYEQSDDDIDYDDNDEGMSETLVEDIELFKQCFGEESVDYRVFKSINDVDVDLDLPTSSFAPEIAKAWKIDPNQPLTVRLHLSLSDYVGHGQHPKVEVFKKSAPKNTNFGIGEQLRRIIQTFVENQWKDLSHDRLKQSWNTHSPQKHKSIIEHLSNALHKIKNPAESKGKSGKSKDTVDLSALKQLTAMGFDYEKCRNALLVSNNDVAAASELLTSSPELLSTLDEGLCDDDAAGNSNEDEIAPYAIKWQNPEDCVVKMVPSLNHGFLAQVITYAQQRFTTLNEFCVICDEKHVFYNGAMLKPTVCTRELCVFAFQTLGVMANAVEAIATEREVVTLLLAMALKAAGSTRSNIVLDPYPFVPDLKGKKQMLFNPEKRDDKQVAAALHCIPNISELDKSTSQSMETLNKRNPSSYPLLQWIIASNRCHISKLIPEKQLNFMETEHQFVLISSPPAMEAKFQQLKKQHGSCFAFHGSSVENWHSIMRNGLLVASGTKLQLHGAAYGSGIYLSPTSSLSASYSGMNSSVMPQLASSRTVPAKYKPMSHKADFQCIALCEVINAKDLKKANDTIWVAPKAEYVCTRFLFVYEGQAQVPSVDIRQSQFQTFISKAIKAR